MVANSFFSIYGGDLDVLFIKLKNELQVFQQIDTSLQCNLNAQQTQCIKNISTMCCVIDEWITQNVFKHFFNDTRSTVTFIDIANTGSYYGVISRLFQNLSTSVDNPKLVDARHLNIMQQHVQREFDTLFKFGFYVPTISHLLRDEQTAITFQKTVTTAQKEYLPTLIITSIRIKGNFGKSERFLEFVQNSSNFFSIVGDSVYTRKCIFENVLSFSDETVWQRRISFKKDGSRLIPLKGPLAGYLIRIIRKESYEAWKKAFEHGLQVEPLLRDKRGNYRARERPDGFMTVLTQFCGKNVMELSRSERCSSNIDRQITETENRLTALRIYHGHSDYHNWCYVMADGKPYVRLIDWDQAGIE